MSRFEGFRFWKCLNIDFNEIVLVSFLDLFGLQLPSLGNINDLLVLLLLVIIGIVIIIVIAKIILFILPAGIIALVVWFLTGSIWLAGIAFLIVAFISLLLKK